MTVLDDVFVPFALSLIDKFGKSIDIIVEFTAYDAETGDGRVTSSPTFTVNATPPDPTKYDRNEQAESETFIAASGLSAVLVTALEKIENVIKITFDSITWHTVKVRPIYSGASIALYQLEIQR